MRIIYLLLKKSALFLAFQSIFFVKKKMIGIQVHSAANIRIYSSSLLFFSSGTRKSIFIMIHIFDQKGTVIVPKNHTFKITTVTRSHPFLIMSAFSVQSCEFMSYNAFRLNSFIFFQKCWFLHSSWYIFPKWLKF